MPRRVQPPKYRHQKSRNLAVVRLAGRDVYLGKYGSAESLQRYASLVAAAVGDASHGVPQQPPSTSSSPGRLTVGELILRYWEFAEREYCRDGRPTDEQNSIRAALRPVRALYGSTAADEFGPKALKAVRTAMVERGWSRKYINDNVNRVKRIFKWAVAEELLPASVYQSLQAVAGLRRGRSPARDSEPVRPVAESDIRAILPIVSAPVRAMIELQLLTGARPGEIRRMRPCDVRPESEQTWVYEPAAHKTQHLGIERRIYLGPRAQAVLKPWLQRNQTDYCFSPREAVVGVPADSDAVQKSTQRRTGSKVPTGRRPPGNCYTKDSYRRAVERACLRAGIEPWSPNQLRHTCATRIRARYDIDAARVVLGHTDAEITSIYAEKDFNAAARVMAEIG